MTAGGYIFEKINLTYDAGTNGASVRTWALAVHKARCEAFIKATKREQTSFGGNGWRGVVTSLYNEIPESYDGVSYYIQDIHPTSIDSSELYPAFVSFFEMNDEDCEYCIVTAKNYHCYSAYSDINSNYNYGLYMHESNLRHLGAKGAEFGQSLGHAYAHHGFAHYNVAAEGMIITDCTPISPAFTSKYWSTGNFGTYDSYSLIKAYEDANSYIIGKTYQFGYAVKEDTIEVFMRRTDSNYWLWSIIGNIIGRTITAGDSATVCTIWNNYFDNEIFNNNTANLKNPTDFESYMCSFTDSGGSVYDSSNQYVRTYYSCYGADYPIGRATSDVLSDGILYSAVFVGAYCTDNEYSYSDSGLDGNGNCAKGYINTECLRIVSNQLCRVAGTTFQNGNFVAMKSGSISFGIGYLLGWDSSNESIIINP